MKPFTKADESIIPFLMERFPDPENDYCPNNPYHRACISHGARLLVSTTALRAVFTATRLQIMLCQLVSEQSISIDLTHTQDSPNIVMRGISSKTKDAPEATPQAKWALSVLEKARALAIERGAPQADYGLPFLSHEALTAALRLIADCDATLLAHHLHNNPHIAFLFSSPDHPCLPFPLSPNTRPTEEICFAALLNLAAGTIMPTAAIFGLTVRLLFQKPGTSIDSLAYNLSYFSTVPAALAAIGGLYGTMRPPEYPNIEPSLDPDTIFQDASQEFRNHEYIINVAAQFTELFRDPEQGNGHDETGND